MAKILVACEYSGRVRDAFLQKGHEAVSCDLLPTDSPGPHYQGDVRDILHMGWDILIAHPPCTYLAVSGLHWNKRGVMVDGRPRSDLTEDALRFVQLLLSAPVKKIALENPIGCISTRIKKPDQVIQPWWFGDDASKATCLWLKNLPLLTPTKIVKGRKVVHNGKAVERWGNQLDSGQNRLPPSEDRWKIRSVTYGGGWRLQWRTNGVRIVMTENFENELELLGGK
jgi:hypothetical protein